MLQSAFLTPKAAEIIQIVLKVYTKRHIFLNADLANTV